MILIFALLGLGMHALILYGLGYRENYMAVGTYLVLWGFYIASNQGNYFVAYKDTLRDMFHVTMGAGAAKASYGVFWQYPL
jgi:hypothetical protein